jgi:hypothetical protein
LDMFWSSGKGAGAVEGNAKVSELMLVSLLR